MFRVCQPQEAKSPAKEVPSLKVNNKFVTLLLRTEIALSFYLRVNEQMFFLG